jgi:hypothetical protein
MTSNDIWKIIKAKGTKTYCSASIALLVTVIVFIISNFPEVEALRMPLVTEHSKCPKLQIRYKTRHSKPSFANAMFIKGSIRTT